MVSFAVQDIFSFMEYHLLIIYFEACTLSVIQKVIAKTHAKEPFFLCFPLGPLTLTLTLILILNLSL